MQEDIRSILLTAEAIESRVRALSAEIGAAYGEHEFVLMPILTGAVIFVADLMRHLPRRIRIEVLAVSSYPGASTASQGAQLLYPSSFNVAGKHVLIVDDILDSGATLAYVTELLRAHGAADVKSCVLLCKKLDHPPVAAADFVGFEIPNEFVVGYGLDYDDYYRNLPHIAVLHDHVIKAAEKGETMNDER